MEIPADTSVKAAAIRFKRNDFGFFDRGIADDAVVAIKETIVMEEMRLTLTPPREIDFRMS